MLSSQKVEKEQQTKASSLSNTQNLLAFRQLIAMTRPQATNIPSEFLCPITKQLMKEPVMSKYGHHFDRSAIMKHLEDGNHFCPVTGNPLRPSCLVGNKSFQWKIKYWTKINSISGNIEATTDTAQLKSVGFAAVPPSRFICPLTQKCMKDPVMTKQGVNFERKAILKWLDSAGEELCPVTHTPLYRRMLVSNSKLQWEIVQWHMKNGTVEIENDAGDETVSSITSYTTTEVSLYSKAETSIATNSNNTMEYPTKLSGAEMDSRGMVPSLVRRHLPTSRVERNKSMYKRKTNLLDALDAAISCSLRV
jgi:hypothetical protein